MSQHALSRRFEGGPVLARLLADAGAKMGLDEVFEGMLLAQETGMDPDELFPNFFDDEPRFADPSAAKRLYGNLFGLWDLVASGATVDLAAQGRAHRNKPAPAPRPTLPEGHEPDEAYVEGAWRYLDDLKETERRKLLHAFDNRQDALLSYLDGLFTTDDGYGLARDTLFELFAMLETAFPAGLRPVRKAELRQVDEAAVPAALLRYAQEALDEAELDADAPLPDDERARVHEAVRAGLCALWQARPV